MAINYANVQVTKVMFRRGNTIQNNRYIGIYGEITVNTENHTLRLHDGLTPGGFPIGTGGAGSNQLINGNASATLDPLGNLTLSGNTLVMGNSPVTVINGTLYVNGSAVGSSNYGNTNVRSYLGAFDGNIVPSANSVYSLGSITNQWRDLWVSNNTIYINGIPLGINASNDLTVNGNVVGAGSNYSNANVASYLPTYNGNIGNLWIDSTTYSPDLWLRTRQNNNIYISPDDINHLFLPTAVSGSQLALAGYGLGGAGVFSSNSYVQLDGNGWDSGIELRTSFNSNNYTWTFGTDATLTLPTTGRINFDYLSISSYSDVSTFYAPSGNVQLAAGIGNAKIVTNSLGSSKTWTFGTDGNLVLPEGGYLGNVWGEPSETTLAAAPGGFVAIANSSGDQYVDANDNNVQIGTNYRSGVANVWLFYQNGWLVFPDGAVIDNGFFKAASNSSVNLLSNNEHNQIRVDNTNVEIYTSPNGSTQYQWTFNQDGNLTFPTGASITNGYPGGTVGDGQGWFVTPSGNGGGVASADGQQYVQVNNGYGVEIGTGWPGNAHAWHFGLDGNLTLPDNIAAINYANGVSILTGIGSNYSNVNVEAFANLSNYAYNANVTAANLGMRGYVDGAISSNISAIINGAPAILDTLSELANALGGDANLSVTITSLISNVQTNVNAINANLSTYAWNANIPPPYGNANVASYLSANGYNPYSNVNVEAFTNLSTYAYNANVTAANVGMKGYVDSQVSAANVAWTANAYQQQALIGNLIASSYSNVNLAAYLSGLSYTNYSNVNVAAYLTTNNYLTVTSANLSLYAWNANVTAANVGIIGYIDQANTIQSNQISAANVGMQGYVNLANSIQSAQITNLANNMYTNANVQAYSVVWTSDLRPSANITYNLGNVTNYWNNTFVNTVSSIGNITAGTDLVAQGNVWAQGGNFRTASSTVFVANVTPTTAWAFGNASAINIGAASSTTTLGGGLGNISALVSGFAIGYRDIPQITLSSNVSITTSDAGKHYYSTVSANPQTLTIANNASQAFSIGATINVINGGTANIIITQGSGVTLYLAGNATASNRTLSSYGMATITKVATNTWYCVGVGLA